MQLGIMPLILLNVLLNAGAQITLKNGMTRIGQFAFSWANLLPISLQVITSPWILLGIAFYVLSVIIWLLVLSRTEVSIAYPLASLGYIVNAVAAYYLLGEDLTFIRIAGIMVILIGVFMVAKN